ncbi:hypothetical protein K438DRAFT_1582373 [Mycena galopus ATCC 62051]|nr:hypothetical protein K438DRAFT_1582373 [Mycena galopus ATCC 62051]
MHPILNLGELLIPLWRGLFECDKTDSRAAWDWVVLIGETWKQHGQAVADLAKYMPGSFDNPPRNPAEKINTGYKAWEYLLYLFGLAPALLFGVLPDIYWEHHCKCVRAFRLLLQEEIQPSEILEANTLLMQYSDEFEHIYVQRRADRVHFVRPIIHTTSHMPSETIRKGPLNLSSQWVMERTIGNLGEEIRQHSDPYANLAQRGIRLNAITTIMPELQTPEAPLPRGSLDLDDGFVLLRPLDNCSRDVLDCEAEAIRCYIREHCEDDGEETADNWRPSVVRWGRVRLPNEQTARSLWNEKNVNARRSRVVKIEGTHHHIAVASFFGPPDEYLLEKSSQTYWSVQHQREADVRAFKIKSIDSCVMMGPDGQYRHHRDDESAEDRWFLMEKPGLKLAQMMGYNYNDENDEDS